MNSDYSHIEKAIKLTDNIVNIQHKLKELTIDSEEFIDLKGKYNFFFQKLIHHINTKFEKPVDCHSADSIDLFKEQVQEISKFWGFNVGFERANENINHFRDIPPTMSEIAIAVAIVKYLVTLDGDYNTCIRTKTKIMINNVETCPFDTFANNFVNLILAA